MNTKIKEKKVRSLIIELNEDEMKLAENAVTEYKDNLYDGKNLEIRTDSKKEARFWINLVKWITLEIGVLREEDERTPYEVVFDKIVDFLYKNNQTDTHDDDVYETDQFHVAYHSESESIEVCSKHLGRTDYYSYGSVNPDENYKKLDYLYRHLMGSKYSESI